MISAREPCSLGPRLSIWILSCSFEEKQKQRQNLEWKLKHESAASKVHYYEGSVYNKSYKNHYAYFGFVKNLAANLLLSFKKVWQGQNKIVLGDKSEENME